MDGESEDKPHTLGDTVESSQAMNLDQGTSKAGEVQGSGGSGEQAGTGDQDQPASKRIKNDEEAIEGDEIFQQEIKRYGFLPLDVWMMIGADLDPLDLLQLTRVNKSLRRLFTSKRDTQRIWKKAFQNVGFPALKAHDWDLVALANLLDEVPRCVACGKQGPTIEVDIATRISVHPVRNTTSILPRDKLTLFVRISDSTVDLECASFLYLPAIAVN